MNRASIAGSLIAIVVATATARADTLTLRDGSVLAGSVRQVDGGFEYTAKSGAKRFVAADQVRGIKLDAAGAPDEATARERLASLRRSLENERDVARAIDRYEQFLTLNEGTAAAKDARTDLATWKDRRERKMTKVGGRWMTADDRDQLLLQIAGRVDALRGQFAAGDLDRAGVMLRDLATLDPDNISVLYLDGVLQYRRNQFAESKRRFDAVLEQVPDHPPSLVNDAVLLVTFKRWPQAAGALDLAMAAAPVNRVVLDEVTEFIQLVPESLRKTLAIERLLKTYGVQESALEQRMLGEQGLYRLGSRWVDKAGLEAAKHKADELDQTKRQMDTDYAQAQDRQRQTEQDADRIQHMLEQIDRDRYVRDSLTGRGILRPYPDAYWDLKRDLDQLLQRHKEEQEKIDDLKKRATTLPTEHSAGLYAGAMTLIGEAGVPILLPASSPGPTTSTMPTTTGADTTPSGPTLNSGAPYRGGPYAPPGDVAVPVTQPTSRPSPPAS